MHKTGIDCLELQIRLEEISAGLTLFTDTIEDEFNAAGEEAYRGFGYVMEIMPVLHMVGRSVMSLKEEIEKELC